AGAMYRIGAFAQTNTWFWREDLPNVFADVDINFSYRADGDNFPSGDTFARWWFVDFRYATQTSIATSPTKSVTFTNGVWAGMITFAEPGTNVLLRAKDSSGHTGLSAPLDVGLQISEVFRSIFD